MSKFRTVIFVWLLCWPGIVFGQVKPAWEAEWEKTEAAARKEGKLSIFLFRRDNIETAVRAFEKKYPEIKITTVATSAPQTGPRMMAERRANKHLWDICICGPTTPYRTFYRANALDPIKSVLILPEVLDESKWWGGKHHYLDPEDRYIFVYIGNISAPSVYYNIKLVKPDEVKSYWDLVDPKWKGKFATVDRVRHLEVLYQDNAWGREKTLDYARRLAANNLIIERSRSGQGVKSALECVQMNGCRDP